MTRLMKSVATFTIRPRTASTLLSDIGSAALATVVACLFSLSAAAQDVDRRVALVIGNSSYVSAPALPNPVNDATAMSDSLRRLGFDVQTGIDLDAAGMVSTLRAFGARAEAADVALVFYAGHGVQVDGQNYLLPVDANLERERDLNYDGVPLDLILSEVSQARRLAVVILDACRDNPLASQLRTSMGPTRSTVVGRGLALVDAPADTLVAFATRDGAVAEDGAGINSPFTAALLTHLGEPGVEIGNYFRRVRDSVMTSTNGRQEPFVYGSLSADQFYLNPGHGNSQRELALSLLPVQPAGPTDLEADMLFWRSIQGSNDATEYLAYLSRFPGGVFADIARNRVTSIDVPETDRGAIAVLPVVGSADTTTTTVSNRRRWNNRYRDNDRDDGDDGDDDDGDD